MAVAELIQWGLTIVFNKVLKLSEELADRENRIAVLVKLMLQHNLDQKHYLLEVADPHLHLCRCIFCSSGQIKSLKEELTPLIWRQMETEMNEKLKKEIMKACLQIKAEVTEEEVNLMLKENLVLNEIMDLMYYWESHFMTHIYKTPDKAIQLKIKADGFLEGFPDERWMNPS